MHPFRQIRSCLLRPDRPEKKMRESRNIKFRIAAALVLCLASLAAGIGLGSVSVPLSYGWNIFLHETVGTSLSPDIDPILVSIFWSIRFPRTLTAFLVGGALAASGAVMQSVLQNPLASSYTLGVSSGASVGAAVILVTGFSFPLIGAFTLPLVSFLFGLATVFLAIGFSAKIDRNLKNQTIILVGMVLSLFVNAILTLIAAMAQENSHRLLLWEMGSFSSKNWYHVSVLFPVCLLGVLVLIRFSRVMDIMTFGDEQAMAIGVDTGKMKKFLIGVAAFLTGVSVCFTGVIGFIDLIAPHVVRRIFGSSHRIVLPMSFLTGGAFMALADLISRTILSPEEIPVGAVTALIGAPFFAWVFFRGGRGKKR